MHPFMKRKRHPKKQTNKNFQNLIISMFHRFLLCFQVYISEMSSPQATHCLRIICCNKAVSFSHKNVLEKRKIREGKKKKKDTLVVSTTAAFTATAGFSGSFTEPEAGKCASITPNQGLFYLFIRKRRRRKGKDAIWVFVARWLLFLRLGLNTNARPALKIWPFSFFDQWHGEATERKSPSFPSCEYVFAYTGQKPFLSSLYENSDLIVCCLKRQGLFHCHNWQKDKMKRCKWRVQNCLLSSNQGAYSLRILTEADFIPCLNSYTSSHFKHATSPTHMDDSYSAMIQLAQGTVSYIDMNIDRPTEYPQA